MCHCVWVARRTDGHCVCCTLAPTGWMDTKTLSSMPIIQLNFVDTPYNFPLAGTQCPQRHYWHPLWTHWMDIGTLSMPIIQLNFVDTPYSCPLAETLSMPIIQHDFVDTPYSCPLAGTQCPPKHYWHPLWTHWMDTACDMQHVPINHTYKGLVKTSVWVGK